MDLDPYCIMKHIAKPLMIPRMAADLRVICSKLATTW